MFHYHPHLASGIFYAFSGIGGLTFPLLYGALIEEYTVHGLLLIVGGLYLNLAAVALFLEPKVLMREQLRPVVQRGVKVSTINGEGQTENESCSNNKSAGILRNQNHTNTKEVYLGNINKGFQEENQEIDCDISRNGTRDKDKEKYCEIDKTIQVDRKSRCSTQGNTVILNGDDTQDKEVNLKSKILLYIKMDQPSKFWSFALVIILSQTSYFSFLYQLPSHSVDLGMSLWESTVAMSVFGCTELVARIAYGQVADFKYCNRFGLILLCLLISVAALFSLSSVHHRWMSYALSAILGTSGGIHVIFLAPLVHDIVRPERLGSGVALINGLAYFLLALVQPIFGRWIFN